MGTKTDVVTAIYQAFGEGDVGTILTHLTDDVDWAPEAAGTVAPWWGHYAGKDEVPGFFRALAESVDVTEFTPLAMVEGPDDVMVTIRFGVTVKSTGRSGTMEIHHWWHFDGDKVSRYRGTEDTDLTARLFSR